MVKQRRCLAYGNQEIADIGPAFHEYALYPILAGCYPGVKIPVQ